MAPLPAEPDESPAGGLESQRSLPTPFLTKTYQLVDDPSVDDLISWNEDGSTFVVWRPAEFARDLLPKYFKHNNFSSFVRQLNTYGFRKLVPDRWEFANDCFRRGEKGLLIDIQRRKVPPVAPAAVAVTVAAVPVVQAVARTLSPTNSGDEQVISSNSSPTHAVTLQRTTSCTTTPELQEENERLRKENMQLSQELTRLRGLCNNIFALMTNYASGQIESTNSNIPEGKPLDLLPAKSPVGVADDGGSQESPTDEADDVTPKLFGVSIGVKRVRTEEQDAEEEEKNQAQQEEKELGSDGKAEPSDRKDDNQDHTWLELGK
ncbi:hypothetical protein SLE2022_088310 [Rubroshorea leprosula]